MKKILILLVLSLTLSGCMKTKEEIKVEDPSIKLCEVYIQGIQRKDQQQIQKILMGEALKAHMDFKNNNYSMDILEKDHKKVFSGEYIQIIEGTYSIALTSKDNVRYVTKVGFRYYLRNQDGWKIYKIEEQNMYNWPEGHQDKNSAAVDMVKAYIEKVASGKWEQAVTHLSGKSLDKALKVVAGGKNLRMTIENLKIQVLDGDDHSVFIIARYQVKVLEKENSVTLVFYLEKIDGQWQIFDIAEG
ncbi:hypothetical protein [Thermotalea metallivorans]|uniref:Lipoprotein n=1 Tax=Thermotalea metallivorans TaxID=520762 RepID=A0A140L9X9_9FIRM|nr:hypothetical protein [Thermotalea metallivorans]KXG77354.1 hypothetical protein AN619_04800 [Thermotalea metallivorans]